MNLTNALSQCLIAVMPFLATSPFLNVLMAQTDRAVESYTQARAPQETLLAEPDGGWAPHVAPSEAGREAMLRGMARYGLVLGYPHAESPQPASAAQHLFLEESHWRPRGTNIDRQALYDASPDGLPLLVALHGMRWESADPSGVLGDASLRTAATGEQTPPGKFHPRGLRTANRTPPTARQRWPTAAAGQKSAGGIRQFPDPAARRAPSVLPGFIYLGDASPWGWEPEEDSSSRFGHPGSASRLGNRSESSTFVSRQIAPWASISIGVRAESWSNTNGSDPDLESNGIFPDDPYLPGGKRVSALLGFTIHPGRGPFRGQYFNVLLETPVSQSFDRPQRNQTWGVRIAWRLAF